MPVPKRKTSKSRRDKRQSCKFIRPQAFTACSNCAVPMTPHAACADCGFYKGKKVLATKGDRAVKRTEIRQKQAVTKAARDAAQGGEEETKNA